MDIQLLVEIATLIILALVSVVVYVIEPASDAAREVWPYFRAMLWILLILVLLVVFFRCFIF